MNLKVSAAVVISTFILFGCGGGGGGGGSSYIGPSVTGTTYSGNTQTKTYSDGTTVTNTASSSSVSWASDHVTRTTVYSYADGGSNSVVDTVNPTVSTPTLTAAIYPSNWTTTGTVTAPTVSAKNNVYGDGYISAIEDGSSSKPFAQSTLSALSITDPNKYVTSSTTTYNLTWGTPDKDGPAFANLFPNASSRLSSNLSYMGVTVRGGDGGTGPTLVQPATDVLQAWNAGWTGKGVNVVTIDDYASVGTCNSASSCHGITTMMITDLIAPGATKYALDWDLTTNGKNINGISLTSLTQMKVVNMSFGANLAYSNNFVSKLQLVDPGLNVGASSAVLVKSAGNNSGRDTYSYTAGGDHLVQKLVDNSNTVSRLLIVGALNKNGTTSSPATIASYSNVAGSTAAARDRFVVANGNAPFAAGGVQMNAANINGYDSSPNNYGTSYAAPVVAGYAAIIMHKFPNLTAANTSNIILDTARTDTLSCHPSCSAAIYGKGEASLSRALAPVGSLR
jgi:hypothetical protein